ncbi:MAG: hypothetical protein IH940_12555 [Acidobacteria bacterium]|nr:hypothetical protein [Acidobacteriota bacterium]
MASRLAGKIIAVTVVAAGIAAVTARLRPRPNPATGTAQWQPLAPNPAERDASASRAASDLGASRVEPDFVESSDGSCPSSHPVKGNTDSGIFHVPGGLSYKRTNAERCYIDADAALADGLRQAKR